MSWYFSQRRKTAWTVDLFHLIIYILCRQTHKLYLFLYYLGVFLLFCFYMYMLFESPIPITSSRLFHDVVFWTLL